MTIVLDSTQDRQVSEPRPNQAYYCPVEGCITWECDSRHSSIDWDWFPPRRSPFLTLDELMMLDGFDGAVKL